MSRSDFKIYGCVICVVYVSQIFIVMSLICVTHTTSIHVQSPTMLHDNPHTSSTTNSSHLQNPILAQTMQVSTMNMIDHGNNASNYSNTNHQQTPTRDATSWSEDLWKQLQYNMKSNFTNENNISNIDHFRIPFYYNYEEYFQSLNGSIMDEYGLWDELHSNNGPNDFEEDLDANRNLTDRMSSLESFYSILTNLTGTPNTSISLSDIIISHALNSIMSQQNRSNYKERTSSLDQPAQFRWPPWNNLTSEQKHNVLIEGHGQPQKYSNVTVIGLTAYYSVILSVGIPGNGLTLLIILTNSYMRTAPNIFLLNIALADLVTLTLVVPIEVKMLFKAYPWPFGEIGCAAATTICELATHVLIVTMIAFSLERYFAICHPLKPSLQSGKKRTTIIILVIWLLCLIPSACWTIYSKVEYLYYSTSGEVSRVPKTRNEENEDVSKDFIKIEESAICVVSPSSVTPTMATMTVLTTIGLYVLPILILPWLYSRIAKALKESENYSQAVTRNGISSRNRRTVVRMQMAVIACFLICWTPYHVQRMMFVILTRTNSWKSHPNLLKIQETLHLVSGCCYFLSSAINPFLYSLLSKRFRRGFQDLTHKMVRNWRNRASRSSSSREIRNARQALAQASTLPNNFSFCFKNRQVNNRDTLRRHFNLPHSSVAQQDNDLKEHQNLELEMQGIAHQNQKNSIGYNTISRGLSEAQTKKATVKKLNSEDVERIASMLKLKKKHLNCKYKVVFRSHSNKQGTTFIVNASEEEKNIPRCPGINDLRYVGTTSTSLVASSVIYVHGTKTKTGQVKFNSVAEDKSNPNRQFCTSLSSQPCKEV